MADVLIYADSPRSPEMGPEVRRAIAGIELTSYGSEDSPKFVTKVKFWDKVKGLELLGKHLGLFVEKHEHKHDVTDSFATLLAEATKRERGGS